MDFVITPMDSDSAESLRAGIAGGRVAAERHDLTEPGGPCRRCLQTGEPGESLYLLTWQPFRGESPYAVPSPIFLHVHDCDPPADATAVPRFVAEGGLRTVRSYDADHRIVDGAVVAGADVAGAIATLLDDDGVAYVHVHCAVNGCFTFRADPVLA